MASPRNFAAELTAASAQIRPDMDKYMTDVKEQCMSKARKGHAKAYFCIHDCLSTLEEIQQEVELLGITVDQCRWLGTSTIVELEVHWSNHGNGTAVGQPSGLEFGNLKRVCKICLDTETMCRLHPCGHIIGMECAKALIDKPCSFCRKPVRFVHPIFEP